MCCPVPYGAQGHRCTILRDSGVAECGLWGSPVLTSHCTAEVPGPEAGFELCPKLTHRPRPPPTRPAPRLPLVPCLFLLGLHCPLTIQSDPLEGKSYSIAYCWTHSGSFCAQLGKITKPSLGLLSPCMILPHHPPDPLASLLLCQVQSYHRAFARRCPLPAKAPGHFQDSLLTSAAWSSSTLPVSTLSKEALLFLHSLASPRCVFLCSIYHHIMYLFIHLFSCLFTVCFPHRPVNSEKAGPRLAVVHAASSALSTEDGGRTKVS